MRTRLLLDAPPAPPEWGRPVQALHWLTRVLPSDHRDLGFAASLLAHAIRHGGLSERQERWAGRIFDQACADWEAAQAPAQTRHTADLSRIAPKGRA